MNPLWLLLIPTILRADLVFSCPFLTWSKDQWDAQVKRSNSYSQAGLDAQEQWIGTMIVLYAPFLFLAAILT